jgi:outer membrane protein assembly factor BamA
VPGQRALIDTITVLGQGDIDESLVRRTIPLQEGRPYSQVGLVRSQQDLYRLGVFDFVNVSLADSMFPADDDSTVAVRVQVSEGRLRRIRAGAGYGTLDCFRTLTSYTWRNFLGGGRTLNVSARLSKIGAGDPFNLQREVFCQQLDDGDTQEERERLKLNYNLTASLRFPYVLSPNTSAAVSLSAERRSEINTYLREAVGVNLALTRQTGIDLPITLSYSLTRGRTSADAASLCAVLGLCTADARQLVDTARIQSTIGLGVVRTRTNSAINPSRGNQLAMDLRLSDEVLGSDSLAQFFKWVAEGASYHRVRRRSVFSWRVRIGAILAPGFSGQGQETEFIPTEERFYGGGPNTVRGFPPNELGPVVRVIDTVRVTEPTEEELAANPNLTPTVELDTLVSPTGGNQLFLANAEFRFPLLGDRVGGAVFVDAGQVFVRGESFAPFDRLRVTPGVGVRFYTPLGPVRLDLAYNPHRPEAGELFVLNNEDVVLADLDNPIFQPERKGSFLGRLRLNFSIGEAF